MFKSKNFEGCHDSGTLPGRAILSTDTDISSINYSLSGDPIVETVGSKIFKPEPGLLGIFRSRTRPIKF